MKNRLQKLWKATVPPGVTCPQPEPDEVLRRVGLALGEKPRPRARRLARGAVLLAAVWLLLAGISLAAGAGLLPEGNVLDVFFGYGKDREIAASLVETAPISVSDEQYTMTVTSSVADHNTVYFTLEVKPRTDAAREYLESGGAGTSAFDFRVGVWGDTSGSAVYKPYDPETGTLSVAASKALFPIFSGTVRVRFEPMREGLWLRLPVHPVPSIRLRMDAEGQGRGTRDHAAGGPVTLRQVKLSPLAVWMEFTTPTLDAGTPTLFFLWKDGHVSTMSELRMHGPSGSSADTDGVLKSKESWEFGSVQDLTKMEAVIFEGMAYPLDGGEPYPFDDGGLPMPFSIPLPEELSGVDMQLYPYPVPLSALCDGLGIPFRWDARTQTAVMAYRGAAVSVQAGSRMLRVQGGSVPPEEMAGEAVWVDGELWAYASPYLEEQWQIGLDYAYENAWAEIVEGEEQPEPSHGWVVTP